jgi:hypothetical protein
VINTEDDMKRVSVLALGALVLGLAGTGFAQKSVSEAVSGKTTATIQTIDSTNRVIALKTEDGDVETFVAGPEVKRFNELKVGDKVNFHFTESLAFDLRKPGEAAKAAGEGASMSAGAGPKPSASFYKTQTATVTVQAVDPKVPSITVKGEDGDTITHKVKEENRKALDGVKPGDRIDISYTQTLTIDVEAPKAK